MSYLQMGVGKQLMGPRANQTSMIIKIYSKKKTQKNKTHSFTHTNSTFHTCSCKRDNSFTFEKSFFLYFFTSSVVTGCSTKQEHEGGHSLMMRSLIGSFYLTIV